MIIKPRGFFGLGVDYVTPSSSMDWRELRAYHALWMAEFKWHHALRHWLFGGFKPLPLSGPDSISNLRGWPAIWRRVALVMHRWWHRATKSDEWREFNNWYNSLPEAPEPGESSVAFVDQQGKWKLVAKITREGILKWLKLKWLK
jgi:hypothetical protein